MRRRRKGRALSGTTAEHRAAFSREAFHTMSFADDAAYYVESKKCRLAFASLVSAAVSLGKAKGHAGFTGQDARQGQLPGISDKMDKLDDVKAVFVKNCVK